MERKLREALLDAPDMFSFRDEDALIYFQNVRRLNPESPVLRFAINWARLVEKELKKRGELDKETIEQCKRLADTVGNSGFTLGWATTVLIVYWEYGYKYLTSDRDREKLKEKDIPSLYMTDEKLRDLQKNKAIPGP